MILKQENLQKFLLVSLSFLSDSLFQFILSAIFNSHLSLHSNSPTTLSTDSWFLTEFFPADWWFEYFSFFSVVSDDKKKHQTETHSATDVSSLFSIFHRGFKFLFCCGSVFYCYRTLKKICGFWFENEWMKEGRESVECLWWKYVHEMMGEGERESERGKGMEKCFSHRSDGIVDETLDERQ